MKTNLQIIKSLKADNFDESLSKSLLFVSEKGEHFSLVPVGKWILENKYFGLWEEFAQWRKHSRENFLARFNESAESTKNYLKNYSIEQENRILFTIWFETACIGHIGFSNISKNSAEIDNVMKSPFTDISFPMLGVMEILIKWIKDTLNIREISLVVVGANNRAITLYERVGFVKVTEQPLKEVSTGDETKLVPCEFSERTTNTTKLTMKLRENEFQGK